MNAPFSFHGRARGLARMRGLALASFAALLALGAAGCAGCQGPAKLGELVVRGDDRQLRKRPEGSPENSPTHPGILFLAFDGVDRALLYEMLRAGQLPKLSALLGGTGGKFPHAYFEDSLLSTLPSSTMAAWSTTMTGVPPSQHGITGNEFFIRQQRRLAAPAPASFADSAPTLAIYTDSYLNALIKTPTVYERMRERDPHVLIWVAVHQIFRGADRLLVAKPTVMVRAFEEFVAEKVVKAAEQEDKPSHGLYETLDKDVVGVVTDALDKGPMPDVLTVYLTGTDMYAHVAAEGPDEARRMYLREVVDGVIGDLTASLQKRDALANRYVVLTSDHGHTQVLYDDAHALSDRDDDPPTLVKKAGFRLRPFKLDVSIKDDFDAVLAYGGATAFVYVADRSTCPKEKDVCDWGKPARWQEDVVPMAEAFYKNNQDGSLAPGMKGTLDLILTRKPKSPEEDALPFEVYVGGGKTVSVDAYLKQNPTPSYVAVDSRLRDLAAGPVGDRAGDIMLIAHNGDRATPDQRYYFASRYRSWHGSPSKKDSEIPLIVAHPHRSAADLRTRVQKLIGPDPRQQKVTDLLLGLRSEL